jgi:hypothetical protein
MILTVLQLTINPYPKQGRHGISGYHFCFMVVHKNSKKKKKYFAKPSGVAGNSSHLSFISSFLGETAGISLSFLPFPLFLFLHFLA